MRARKSSFELNGSSSARGGVNGPEPDSGRISLREHRSAEPRLLTSGVAAFGHPPNDALAPAFMRGSPELLRLTTLPANTGSAETHLILVKSDDGPASVIQGIFPDQIHANRLTSRVSHASSEFASGHGTTDVDMSVDLTNRRLSCFENPGDGLRSGMTLMES